jgi:hypothetical protein
MASSIRSELMILSRVLAGHGDRIEKATNDDRQVRSQCLQLLDAELEQMPAAGGGIRVGSDGANN